MSINYEGFIPTYLTIYSNQTSSEVLQFIQFDDILKISNFYSSLSRKCNVNGSVRVEWDCPNKGQVYAGRKNLSTLISGIRMLNTRGKILIQLVSEYHFFSLKMIGKRCCTDFNYSNQELWNKVWNFVELYIQRLIDLLPSSDGDSGYGRLILAGQKEKFQTDLNDCDCESINKYDHINNYQIAHLPHDINWNGTYHGNDNNSHTITNNINKINILIKLINNEIKKQNVVGWGCTIDLGLHSLAFVPELVAKDLNNYDFGLQDWYGLGVYSLSEKSQIIPLNGPVDVIAENYTSTIYIEYFKSGSNNWVQTDQPMIFDTGSVFLILPYFSNLDPEKYQVVEDNIKEPWGCPAKIVKGPIRLGKTIKITDCYFIACTDVNTNGTRTHICGSSVGSRSDYTGATSPIMQVCQQLKRSFFEVVINEKSPTSKSQIKFSTNKPAIYNQKTVGGPFPIIKKINLTAIAIQGLYIDDAKPMARWDHDPTIPYIGLLDTGGGPIMINDDVNGSLKNNGFNEPSTNCPSWSTLIPYSECFKDQVTVQITSNFKVKYPNNEKIVTVLFPKPSVYTSWGKYKVSLNFGGAFFLYAYNMLVDTKLGKSLPDVYLHPK